MPDHHLAFADIMAELMGKTPDKPSDPPVVKSESVLEDKTDLVLESLLGPGTEDCHVHEVRLPEAEKTVDVPEVVGSEAASTPSGFYAAVARFKAMRGGS